MDSVFGIGLPELVLILVIAGMVMGPERIVRMARTLGALTARLQNISRSFLRQLSHELDSVDDTGQLRGTAEELKRLQKEVSDLRKEVLTLATGESAGKNDRPQKTSFDPGRSIMPPTSSQPFPNQNESGSVRNSTVNRPPSLAPEKQPTSYSEDAPIHDVNRPPRLPKRVEVAEDPDA